MIKVDLLTLAILLLFAIILPYHEKSNKDEITQEARFINKTEVKTAELFTTR
jgi:hypothetical protein